MRICFFGDSFVNGTNDPDCLGWAGRICAAGRGMGADITYYNLGVRRDTSDDIARRWHREAACRLSDSDDGRLVFSFGVNDCIIESGQRRVPMGRSLDNLAAIASTASRWKPILLVGPPPIAEEGINSRIFELSTAFHDACRAYDIPYLPIFEILAGSEAWIQEVTAGDGAHPGQRGYALLAEVIGAWPAWRRWMS